MIDPFIGPNLRTNGFKVERVGARLFVSPKAKLTAGRIQDIKDSRLILLAEYPARPPLVEWDEEEAKALIAVVDTKWDGLPNKDLATASGIIQDRIDQLFKALDLAAIRDEVAGLLTALDGILPRRVGKGVQVATYDRPTFTAWLRMSKNKPWLAVMSDVGERELLEEAIVDYSKLFKSCDILVLASGETP